MNGWMKDGFLVTGLAVLCLFSGLMPAQTASTGAVTGTLSDASGAVIAGATVKVTHETTGETRTVTSHKDGTFLVPLLPPGSYRLEASSRGFKTLVRTGIQVFVTEKQDVHLTLEVGSASETVEVEAAGELLKTEDSALGNVTDGRAVAELPLVNRNYTQIIGLSPGVVTNVNNASDLGRGSSGLNAADGGFSAHGGATNDNNYQMNGSQVNDLMAAGSFSGGVPIPNPDAIQEFKVQTGQYDASYGRNAGANVNVVTKSGTNELHGSAFEFVRNDIFNANDYFLNRAGQPRGTLKQNQFGGSLGGPIVRNKLFFFGSYQGTRQVNGLDSNAACLSTFNTPPELALLGQDRSRAALGAAFQGQPSAFIPGQSVAADGSNISQQAIDLLNLTLPNGDFLIPAPQNTATGQSSITLNCTYNDDQFVTNADYVQSEKSRFNGRFFWDEGKQNATFPFGFAPMLKGFDQPIETSFRNVTLSHTYTFSSHLLNQVTVGYNRLNNLLVQSEPQVQGQSGLVPFSYSAIGVNAQGFDDQFPGIGVLGQFQLGGNGQGVSLIQNQYNVDDIMSYVRGRHSLRFGGGLSRQQIAFLRFHFLGLTAFPSFPDLLLGNVLISQDLVGEPDRDWRALNAGAFLQDDVKVTSRLTVNLGFRYEHQGALGDTGGRSSIFDIALANPDPPASGSLDGYVVAKNFRGTPPAGVIRAKTDAAIRGDGRNNFAPRVGFSWQVPGSEKVVLRGGYGLFYTRTTGQPFLQLLAAPPYGLIRTQLFVPFSDPFQSTPPTIPFFPPYSPTTALTPTTFSAGFRPPIVQEFSLNTQAELMRDLVLEIGYEGSRGTHLLQFRDFNQALSASPSNPIRGQTDNTLANVMQRVPILGFLPSGAPIIESEGSNWYNAMNVSLKKRFSKGLQFLASYTWARSLTADNAYSTGVNGGVLVGNQNDPRSRYGPDGFIRPHRFVVSYHYELPGPANKSSLPGKVLSGWAVAGITTIQAGQFLTITHTNATNAFGMGGPNQDRPELAAGCSASQLATSGSVTDRLDNYINTACITSPPVITADGGTDFGNIGVGTVHGPDQRNFDIVLMKNTRIRDRFGVIFRAEFFNAFNTPQFAPPKNMGAGTSVSGVFVPDPTFGQITATSVNPRLIQLALKLTF